MANAELIKLNTGSALPNKLATYGRMLIEALNGLRSARDAFIKQRANTGSVASDYAVAAAEGNYVALGYTDANTACKASFDELDTLLLKLDVDTSVTNVRTAIYQFAAKHGIIV